MNEMNDCSSKLSPPLQQGSQHPPLSDSSSLTIRQYTGPLSHPVETQLINNWRGRRDEAERRLLIIITGLVTQAEARLADISSDGRTKYVSVTV